MLYVALLRGVNVGGKAAVGMAVLKTCFEGLGFSDVATYINSGNVLFRTDRTDLAALTKDIEDCLHEQFSLAIKVLLKTHQQLRDIAEALPKTWVNNEAVKCDVLFLWPSVDQPEVLEQLPLNPDVDEARYTPGAVIWRIDRARASKSRISRIVGTPLYAQLTIRNANTTRKLLGLLDAADAPV